MLTWRGIRSGGKLLKVWILPNGWFVTQNGNVYDWETYFPHVTENPDGGIAFSGDDNATVTIGVLYDGEPEAIEWRRSLAPFKRDAASVDVVPPPLTLVGSGAFVDTGQDTILYPDEDDPTVWYADHGASPVILTRGLGTPKGGVIYPHEFAFQGTNYPGIRNDAHTSVY